MPSFTLTQLADYLALPPQTRPRDADNPLVTGVCVDSRQVRPGDLFVALSGEHSNGHRHLKDAWQKGAQAFLVSEDIPIPGPYLRVPDTLKALGQLAKAYRATWHIPLIGLTGSSGKTTTKEMIQQILERGQSILVSQGNYNTDIGVPLTLLRGNPQDRIAVIEMAARHVGEIRYLTEIVQPTVALITNIGVAHLAEFGSVERITQAKTELFRNLPPGATLVLLMDDPRLAPWAQQKPAHPKITVGLNPEHQPQITAHHLKRHSNRSEFILETPAGAIPITLPLPGEHQVRNALLAAGAALAVDAPLSDIQAGLNQFQSQAPGRLSLKPGKFANTLIIDDTYNANPLSMKATLSILVGYPGIKIMVMGDMLELGEASPQFHEDIGHLAKAEGVDYFFGLGPLSQHAVRAFGPPAQHAMTHAALSAELKDLLTQLDEQPQKVLLIKGSRGMTMEEVVSELC